MRFVRADNVAEKIRSDMLLRQLQKKHLDRQLPDVFFANVKNGPTMLGNNLLIMDAVAIKKSWKNPCITGYEIKVSRGDFMRDEKWHGYLKYCHQFNFVCPADMIKPEELPPEVGLIYYNPDKDCLSTKRKALHRMIEMSLDMFYYLVISRTDPDRHPFFSDQKEYLEAWVQNKNEGRSLGSLVGSKMARENEDLRQQVKSLESNIKSKEEKLKQLEAVKNILQKHGISFYRWELEEKLEEALSHNMPPGFANSIELISREVNRLLKKLN